MSHPLRYGIHLRLRPWAYNKLTNAPMKLRIEEAEMLQVLSRLLAEEQGATAIEYGLIAALIAVAAVNAMSTVGQHLSSTFNTVATKL